MKWMIASDLHGSAFYCKKMIEAFERERADRLLLLGDLLYHGPRNDLPEGYAPKEVIPLLNGLKPALLCVRGNCDAEVDQMVLDFPILADYAVLPLGGRLVYATHGHVHNLKNLPPLAPGDILLHGHTHIPAWTEFGEGNLYLNPGSVSIPKEGSAHSYMTLEGETFLWKTLEGEVYRELELCWGQWSWKRKRFGSGMISTRTKFWKAASAFAPGSRRKAGIGLFPGNSCFTSDHCAAEPTRCGVSRAHGKPSGTVTSTLAAAMPLCVESWTAGTTFCSVP